MKVKPFPLLFAPLSRQAPNPAIKLLIKHGAGLLLGAALLHLSCIPAFAQLSWRGSQGDGGNGKWNESLNWSPASVPSSSHALFYLSDTYTKNSATITIETEVEAKAGALYLGRGKTVILELEGGSSLETTASQWQIGADSTTVPDGTGVGAASLTIKALGGEEKAIVKTNYIHIGHTAQTDGNSLTFYGSNLVVEEAGTPGQTKIGRFGNYNSLSVKSGASVTRDSIAVGAATSSNSELHNVGNFLVVDGDGSNLTLTAKNAGALVIGSAGAAKNYATGARENHVSIKNGGLLRLDGNSSSRVNLGVEAYNRSNYIEITGEKSTLELLGGTWLVIGNLGATNLGGNSVRVADGGTMKTSGLIQVFGHNASGQHDGANRLIIDNGGTLTSSATLQIYGLAQLADGGVLKGETVDGAPAAIFARVISGGRFEAAGAGLGSTVTADVQNGGVFAVGLEGAAGASNLTLSSTLDFKTGSTLEIGVHSSSTADTITLSTNGLIAIGEEVVFRLTLNGYTPKAGDKWTVFSNATSSNITGNFNPELAELPLISNGLAWDFSRFNNDGQWEIAVIPEPSISMLFSLTACLLASARIYRRTREKDSKEPLL